MTEAKDPWQVLEQVQVVKSIISNADLMADDLLFQCLYSGFNCAPYLKPRLLPGGILPQESIPGI